MDVCSIPKEGFLRDITKLASFGISFFIFLRGGGDKGLEYNPAYFFGRGGGG